MLEQLFAHGANRFLVDLPGLFARFHADHPAVKITMVEANSDVLLDGLRTGQLDAALASLGAADPDDLNVHVVEDQPIVAAVSHDHELAVHSVISMHTLRGRSLISLPRGTGLRSRLDEACAAAGFAPEIAFEASDPVVLAQLAARGLGTAILPGAFARARPEQLRTIVIDQPALRGRLMFAWRRDGPLNPAGRALVARVPALVERRPPSHGR